MVGLASAGIMIIGLSLIHFKVLRRPEIALVVAIVLAAASLIWPDAAILAIQAGSLGAAICFGIGLWNWISAARQNRHVRPRSAPASKLSSAPSTHSSGLRREMSSRIGTTHHVPLVEARP